MPLKKPAGNEALAAGHPRPAKLVKKEKDHSCLKTTGKPPPAAGFPHTKKLLQHCSELTGKSA
jgi:hypothetical protein